MSDQSMMKRCIGESRLQYLLRVTISALREHSGGSMSDVTLLYDEAECGSECLADDLQSELDTLPNEQESERGLTDVITRLEAENEAIKAADRALADLVEHIGQCSERDLLNCDQDPHPPSVFSVYASQAERALAKLKPFLPTK